MNYPIKRNDELAKKILRVGTGLTILWFGASQLYSPGDWVGYLPEWAFSLTFISTTALVYLNGIFETVTGLFLMFNQFTRTSALLIALHLVLIIYHLGYNEVAVRDFGILVALVALVFMSTDKSLLSKLKK